MYTIQLMKALSLVLGLLFFTPVLSEASMSTALSLPTVEHADMEVTTNVVITGWQRGMAKFAFSLSCIATPLDPIAILFR